MDGRAVPADRTPFCIGAPQQSDLSNERFPKYERSSAPIKGAILQFLHAVHAPFRNDNDKEIPVS